MEKGQGEVVYWYVGMGGMIRNRFDMICIARMGWEVGWSFGNIFTLYEVYPQ